jgi:hypothetical protein
MNIKGNKTFLSFIKILFMKCRTLMVVIIACLFSCKEKNTSEDVRMQLMKSMQTYLYKVQVNNDSSVVKYHVNNVIYFEDTNRYICEFTVNMKERKLDTTGIMKANVSKDFKTVTRLY